MSSLPEWYRDNDCIRTGYRPPKASFKYCLKSLLPIYNEMANIYSHLFGALLFAFLWIYTFKYDLYQKFGLVDKLDFSGFFTGIITCLLISASFHTFNCHSKAVFKFFAKYSILSLFKYWLFEGEFHINNYDYELMPVWLFFVLKRLLIDCKSSLTQTFKTYAGLTSFQFISILLHYF